MSSPVAVGKMAETGFQSNVLAKLLLFAFLVAFVPITTYFTTINHLFEGNATYAAIAAIVSANLVMVAYVIVAFNEDAGPPPVHGAVPAKKMQ